MNKRLFSLLSIFTAAVLLAGCGFQLVAGSGKIAAEDRQVGDFSRITLAGIGDVHVTQGDEVSVRIEAEDNLIPYFETSVSADTLTIGIKPEYIGVSLLPHRPINFYVTTPRIENLKLAGSGNILAGDLQATNLTVALLGSGNISTGKVTATKVEVKLDGSGNISFAEVSADEATTRIAGSGNITLDSLTADKVSSTIAGSGNITLAGVVSDQHSSILGSGDYRAANLQSETASLRVTGSGNSQVWVTETLDASITGSGNVTYTGNPRMDINVSGSGKVRQGE